MHRSYRRAVAFKISTECLYDYDECIWHPGNGTIFVGKVEEVEGMRAKNLRLTIDHVSCPCLAYEL